MNKIIFLIGMLTLVLLTGCTNSYDSCTQDCKHNYGINNCTNGDLWRYCYDEQEQQKVDYCFQQCRGGR